MERTELEEKAKSLGIEINDDMSDDDISKGIKTVEKKVVDDEAKNSVDYWKNEFEKTKDKRDDLRKSNRNLKDKMSELETKLSEAPSQDEFKKIRDQFKDLKEFRTQIEDEKEKEDLKNKSELERQDISHTKEMDTFRKEWQEEKDKWDGLLKDKDNKLLEESKKTESANKRALKGSIIESAAKNEAVNPNQIFRMLKDDFDYDSDLERYVFFDKDEKGKLKDELSIDDYVNKFLTEESNSNLVKSKVNTDGLHTDNNSQDRTKHSDKKRGDYDPKDPKLIEEAEQKNMADVNDYIDILLIRDKKLAKMSNKD